MNESANDQGAKRSSESARLAERPPSGLPVVAGYPGYPASSPARNAAQASAYTAGDAWLVMRRWGWKCTASGLLLAVAAAAIVWLTFVPTYDAAAFLELKSRPVMIAFEREDHSNLFSETQLQTIRSPVVLSRVASQPDVASAVDDGEESAEIWLKKGLKVGFLGRSELCEIRFRAAKPEVAARVANAVMDAYLSLHTASVSEGAKRVVELLKEEKERREGEVRVFQDSVRLISKTAGEDDPSLLHHEHHVIVQQNPLAGLEDKRAVAEVERAVLEAKLTAAEETQGDVADEAPAGELAAALDEHPQVQALKAQAGMIQLRLQEHRRRARDPDDAATQRMESEAAELEAAIRKA